MADQPALDRFQTPAMARGEPWEALELTSSEQQALLDLKPDEVMDRPAQRTYKFLPVVGIDCLEMIVIEIAPAAATAQE